MNDHSAPLNALARKMERIPEPKNLYAGHNSRLPELPREVTVFKLVAFRELPRTTHIHYRFVLVVAVEGEGGALTDGRLLLLRPNEAMLLFPYQYHGFTRFRDQNFRWLFIGFELTDVAILEALRGRVIRLVSSEIEWLNCLVDCHLSQSARKSAGEVVTWLHLLLVNCLRRQSRKADGRGETGVGTPDQRQAVLIGRMAEYVYNHLEQRIALADMARQVAVSGSHLRRLVRRNLGVSLGTFIRRARLSKASMLLRTTPLSVEEVGCACGYSSPYVFSRAFCNEIGMAPRNYRQAIKTGAEPLPLQ